MAMAMFLNGLSRDETVALTMAMTRSGEVLDWAADRFGGPVLDKHSTGGVGDKVSLMLAPILAACGAVVPMISGRGLGHTGGTLDKFDSIPGYQTAPSTQVLRQALHRAGCAIIGQTAELAPADRRLYAIRDVTATVESIPLITASILSKKLAAGLQGLVMDVKCGNGAFADTPEMARALARSLVEVANGAGLPTRALVTDMNQVLGHSAGNALEVLEAVAFLRGEHQAPRLMQVTRLLCAEALQIGRLAADEAAALARIDAVLADGSALQHFARMVAALGGPADFCERAGRLPAGRADDRAGAGPQSRLGATQGDARHRAARRRTGRRPAPRQRPHRPPRRLQPAGVHRPARRARPAAGFRARGGCLGGTAGRRGPGALRRDRRFTHGRRSRC